MTNSKFVYLTRRETFCASHRLHNPKLSDEDNRRIYDKCNNPNGHGHNYILYVTVKGEPDENGLIINLYELKAIIKRLVIDVVDHKHLNYDIPKLKEVIPTIENLVTVFWNDLKVELGDLLYEIRLEESENNIAIYRG
ncbi:MAG: 6-carboxytetrahydropterin synthase [bacterium]|nr:6-carboxytetrahydropterin synthase [bacterium]